MGDTGGYIWFIGLGACLLVLAIGYAVGGARRRKRETGVPNENAAWEQAARETGHAEVARPDTRP